MPDPTPFLSWFDFAFKELEDGKERVVDLSSTRSSSSQLFIALSVRVSTFGDIASEAEEPMVDAMPLCGTTLWMTKTMER